MNEEIKTMSEAEIEVGSYVCSRAGAGPRGSVVEIEADERGADYDLLHVRLFPYAPGAAPQQCQRAVMMRPYPRPVPSRLDYADTPQGDDRFSAALLVCCAERDAVIEGHKAALKVSRSNGQAAHDALCLAEKGHAEAQDMLESLRDELQTLKLDHAALTDTFNEVNAAYSKANEYHHKAQEDLAMLKDEVAAVEAEMERRDKVAREKYAALERDRDNVERIMREAGQRADQFALDLKVVLEREAALREKLRAAQDEVASVGQARDMATTLMHRRQAEYDEALKAATSEHVRAGAELMHDIEVMGTRLNVAQHMISGLQTRLEEAQREADRHKRRAASWQGAAQDALSQMEEMINNDCACALGRG